MHIYVVIPGNYLTLVNPTGSTGVGISRIPVDNTIIIDIN